MIYSPILGLHHSVCMGLDVVMNTYIHCYYDNKIVTFSHGSFKCLHIFLFITADGNTDGGVVHHLPHSDVHPVINNTTAG